MRKQAIYLALREHYARSNCWPSLMAIVRAAQEFEQELINLQDFTGQWNKLFTCDGASLQAK